MTSFKPRVESLLSARLFLSPRLADDRIYFISNLSGHLSLYRMDFGGSVPEPLLPASIALQNPTLLPGQPFEVFPDLGLVLVMIDQDGDENYQPMVVPLTGGYPEPAFGEDAFADQRVALERTDRSEQIVHLLAESRRESLFTGYRADLRTRRLTKLAEGKYGAFTVGENDDHTLTIVGEAYGLGDHVGYLLRPGSEDRELLFGTPIDRREPDEDIAPNSIGDCWFVDGDDAILFTTSLFDDSYGLGTLVLDGGDPEPVAVEGTEHSVVGELERIEHLRGDRFAVTYNVDGCTWVYEGEYDHVGRTMRLDTVLVGHEPLGGGVLKGRHFDAASDRHVLSYTTATSPTQIYTIAGPKREDLHRHTSERVLGIPEEWLAPGEDASFTSYDGLRVSARLYLPNSELGFEGPRPLVYYIHGGPQSQEHPDFAWFSMPLIQLLTLRGFAVFVPNSRGSTGYGFDYMNRVVRDWGGADRLDHVHAMTEVLAHDDRVDIRRAGVCGRSYGGFMTLTLAARHPELWSAAIDMFGPYDLIGFGERIPETWKPFMRFLLGDPDTERDFLIERSPRSYIDGIRCPLLVIQGKNDPRVVEEESAELVQTLRDQGKDVEYLMFEDEGHDVLKYENRVRCYNAMVDFFEGHL